ncbi:hypothetical protein, conserved [Eimeria necatrix]|uniref:Uncharacterized protein n=1 Tax=Eimeria necatrix TaxID=51315 RepID=U6MVE2_9EIME|nr:hypothetical protein, conserved [Eimeria necatrix]CDJ66439.1 hypothetical protein, conserved [Eimeria necatrix]
MEGVLKRDYPSGGRHAKRKSIGRDSIIAGDVARITMFSAFDILPYLDLVGGQIWRLAHLFNAKATIASIEEEFEVLSCVVDALTKDVVDGLHVDTTMAGFGLPHLQLLALNVATDLRHHASVVGANLKSSKKLRTAAKGSKEFSAFFRLLSCHVDGDTEALHAQFGPFASLAIRIALFLRVEVEEHANKGWKDAISVFTGKVFNRKLYEKVVRQMRTNATKFIEKFMGEFSYVPTGKLQNAKKRVKRLFKRKRKTNARAFKHKIDHKVGHIFAKLMLMMWTNGSKHQIDSGPTKVDSTFRLARQFQTYTILNHGMDPIRPITDQIKKSCKGTKVIKHKHWSLLSRAKGKMSGLVNEVETSLAYGLITGHTLSAISEAGRELAAACHEKAPLDLTTRGTKYRLIAELHQCMELRGQAVRFLKLALKNVKSPPEEVTARLFTFLKQILAIRGKDAKTLYKVFLRWQKEGESSREVNQWNDNMDMLNCSWHSSQEEQNHILSEAGKRIDKEAIDEVTAVSQIQTCLESHSARLDLQQAQVNIFSEEVVQATSL